MTCWIQPHSQRYKGKRKRPLGLAKSTRWRSDSSHLASSRPNRQASIIAAIRTLRAKVISRRCGTRPHTRGCARRVRPVHARRSSVPAWCGLRPRPMCTSPHRGCRRVTPCVQKRSCAASMPRTCYEKIPFRNHCFLKRFSSRCVLMCRSHNESGSPFNRYELAQRLLK